MMNTLLQITLSILMTSLCFANNGKKDGEKPNIILIFVDDLGYADLGCQGSPDVKTPHIDKLAENGIRFTDGYVTAPQCAPSRAGLLTGRYQNRFGFEANDAIGTNLLGQKVISEYMKDAGYITGMMGKWGVCRTFEGNPPQKGFDYAYWNHDGNIYYTATPGKHDVQFLKNNTKVDLNEYSTDAIGREAIQFIERNKDKEDPFFLYLPFIAPHLPMQAKKEDLLRFPEVKDKGRRTFLAMMACLDDNIGTIMQTLRKYNIEDNTMIVFLSDNGGTRSNSSLNTPFRGAKTLLLEGGIRVPFIIQWKNRFKGGQIYDNPVISLDIIPTCLAAAEVEVDDKWKLDGVNLLPYLSHKESSEPHEVLYWRFNFPKGDPERHSWAIRKNDWKLIKDGWNKAPEALYNLAEDPGEKNDLSLHNKGKVKELRTMWNEWNKEN